MYLYTLELECHNHTKYNLLMTSSQRSQYVEYSSVGIIYYFVYARPNTINFITADFYEFQSQAGKCHKKKKSVIMGQILMSFF